MRQGTVDAGTGVLLLQAGQDIAITAGQSSQTYEEARRKKTSGFLSGTTRTTVDKLAYTGAEPSRLGGRGHVQLGAGRDVALGPAQTSSVTDHDRGRTGNHDA